MMTREQIEGALLARGARMPTVSDLIAVGAFGDLSAVGAYFRVSRLPVGERPEDHGAMRAGGRTIWADPDVAAAWVVRHNAWWAARMQIPQKSREAL
jgi:hypothetical protein